MRPTKALLPMIACLLLLAGVAHAQSPPFGGDEDVAFAEKVWDAMEGYEDWKLASGIYEGQSPHGAWLKIFATWITVDGESFPIIVKDNYGGRGATPENIRDDRTEFLAAVTIMLQRRPGYDPENGNWFYAKYGKDGSLDQNDNGMKLAGRVAKGMEQGCIACHSQAKGGDYLFSNDQ